MRIAIIGAGFTGLAAGFELTKKGHKVTIFEKDKNPGGLAVGFKQPGWEWSLEKHYHHLFTNDTYFLNLAKEINHEIIISRPKTSVLINDQTFQLDSPLSVLKFPLITIFQRLRMGFVIAFFKYNPYWKPLEKYSATKILPKLMGQKPFNIIWQSLFINKFGKFANDISLAWFWARIYKRTPSLAYPKGGFLEFAESLSVKIQNNSGKIHYNTEVSEITSKQKLEITYKLNNSTSKTQEFDKVIVTAPSIVFVKICPQLPSKYREKLLSLKTIGATGLILRLKKPFFKDNTYWLNVCNLKSPIMAIVEHTNFMNKKFYNKETIIYIGNYKERDDIYFKMNKQNILKLFDPMLKKINPTYTQNIINYEYFKDPFAQPVIPRNYSKIIPDFITPLKNVYLANIEQVYPWDRGTNYAIELGQKIAKIVNV